MVLDHGRVKELETPAALLTDTSGVFYSLAKAANVIPSNSNVLAESNEDNERL